MTTMQKMLSTLAAHYVLRHCQITEIMSSITLIKRPNLIWNINEQICELTELKYMYNAD